MPTVPPTFVPIAAYDHAIPSIPGHAAFPVPGFLDHIDRHDAATGPTPDPELDDFTLLPMESGHAVTETGPSRPPASSSSSLPRSPSPTSRKPRLSLGPLSLHSPSTAIVGTPFDLSPRFEYPFPSLAASASASACDPDGLPLHHHSYAQWPFGAYGHGHVPGWAGFPVSASLPSFPAAGPPYSPLGLGPGLVHPWGRRRAPPRALHAKLHRGEPPVPPSLAQKRRVFREREAAARMGPDAPAGRRESVSRRASLDRRESDETVVGSAGSDEEEKVLLAEFEPPPYADEVTTGAAESPVVSPGEVGGGAGGPALVGAEGEVASAVQVQVLVDTGNGPDITLHAPAAPPVPLVSDTVCIADLCPDFHTATAAADLDTRMPPDALPPRDLAEQIHEPHDNDTDPAPPPPGARGGRPDIHVHIHDGEAEDPAHMHDSAGPPRLFDFDEPHAPDPTPAILSLDTHPPPAFVVDR